MSPDTLIDKVLLETRKVVTQFPVLSDFVGNALQDRPRTREQARALPVTDRVAGVLDLTNSQTRSLTRSIADAAHVLRWQQSYSVSEVGAYHLANYGWFNVLSPVGPFISDAFRISVGYWEKGLTYPQHAHTPEEIYLVLAGGAVFESEGRDAVCAGPGDLIHHTPSQWHGFSAEDSPILAMAFWKGSGLLAKSTLERPS